MAGLVSFFSPCVIPLLPGYLSYATGLSGADLASGEAGNHRGRMLLGSVLFVLGFAVVFVILGATTGGRRPAGCSTWQDEITVVLGALMILLGLVFAGLRAAAAAGVRIHTVPAVGLAAAPLLGVAVRARLDALHRPDVRRDHHPRLNDGTAAAGALLSAVYALGLGHPVHRRRRWPTDALSARSPGYAATRSG